MLKPQSSASPNHAQLYSALKFSTSERKKTDFFVYAKLMTD